MKVTPKSLYVLQLPENHEHRFMIGRNDDPAIEEGATIVAGPFGTMDLLDDPMTDNGWEAANQWIKLNDRLAWNFILNTNLIWDQIKTITEGVSTYDDLNTSWYKWTVIEWPEKLPEYYLYNLNDSFGRAILERYGMTRHSSSVPGQSFAHSGSIVVDKGLRLMLLTQMGGLDI